MLDLLQCQASWHQPASLVPSLRSISAPQLPHSIFAKSRTSQRHAHGTASKRHRPNTGLPWSIPVRSGILVNLLIKPAGRLGYAIRRSVRQLALEHGGPTREEGVVFSNCLRESVLPSRLIPRLWLSGGHWLLWT